MTGLETPTGTRVRIGQVWTRAGDDRRWGSDFKVIGFLGRTRKYVKVLTLGTGRLSYIRKDRLNSRNHYHLLNG